MYLEVFFKWEIISWIKERMLNDSTATYFQFSVVDDTFAIGLNDLPCNGTIIIPLMDEDYILNSGDRKRIEESME